MKILITGKNSYIGNSVKAWLNEKEPSFKVEEISLRNVDLNKVSFKEYDVILHVAGIAHISSNKKLIPEYFRVNRDLAIQVANKAKQEGVKQFIFTSSMAIYGDDRRIGDFTPIDINQPKPNNPYGQSKFEADLAIQKIQTNNFSVSILRIPMVYGVTSKGNFLKLVNFSTKVPFFPKIKNIRSVIHIKNLSELIRLVILSNLKGIFYPQDSKYFNTKEFIIKIRGIQGKKTILLPFLFLPLKLFGLVFKLVNKIYGNKYYEISCSLVKNLKYQLYSIDDVIKEFKDI
jgi:nucleoside-diphosphate-sugar epimerase